MPLAYLLGKLRQPPPPPAHLLKIPSTPRSYEWSLSPGFPTKTAYTFLSTPMRATCPAHLILLDLRKSKNYRASHCATSSILLLLHPF
jgi:hypothetical protein